MFFNAKSLLQEYVYMLQLKGFKKSYNKEIILEIEDFFLDKGIYWIKGENGAGKSTFLKCIAGLIPFEGDIIVNGLINNKKNLIFYRQLVNYFEAEPNYPEFIKGSDLIGLYSEVKKGNDAQINDLLNRLGVDKFQSKKIGHYSSGMLKRLSLALGFIGTPKLLLMDEPFITLQKEVVETTFNLITEYTSAGISVILTSHQEVFKDLTHFPNLKLLLLEDRKLNFL